MSLSRFAKNLVYMGPGNCLKMARNGVLLPEDAWKIVQDGGIFLDVRSDREVAAGLLPGALHIPHTEVPDRIAELYAYKNSGIACYCAVGGRVEAVRTFFLSNGFEGFTNAGGYSDLYEYGVKNGLIPA